MSQMKRSICGTYWIVWSQHNPLSSFWPVLSNVGPLGKIVVGSTFEKVEPPSVESAPKVLPLVSTVCPSSAPLMSGGDPENETLD